MRVICAPDSFKGSLDANSVAEAIRRGILRAAPDWQVETHPLADGGEGTLEILSQHGFKLEIRKIRNHQGEPMEANFGLRGNTAVIESARACGFQPNASPNDALRASSFGVGELITHALDAGATEILLTLGGTATTDGGTGMITALGGRFLTASGEPIQPGGMGLNELSSFDVSQLDARLSNVEFTVLCDVTNPLTGPLGAGRVFAPQKGADSEATELLEGGLENLQRLLNSTHASQPGAGAGGGLGFAALEFLGAELLSGARELIAQTGFLDAIADADLVITGEGSFDSQSLAGKVPHEVLLAARQRGIPALLVCGKAAEVAQAELADWGILGIFRLTDLEPDTAKSIRNAAALLENIGEQIPLRAEENSAY